MCILKNVVLIVVLIVISSCFGEVKENVPNNGAVHEIGNMDSIESIFEFCKKNVQQGTNPSDVATYIKSFGFESIDEFYAHCEKLLPLEVDMKQAQKRYKDAVKRITKEIKKEAKEGTIDLPFESSLQLELIKRLHDEDVQNPDNYQDAAKTLNVLLLSNQKDQLEAIKLYMKLIKEHSGP